MKDKYSKTVEVEKGVIVQVTEYIEKKLLVNIAYVEGEAILSKALMLTEDEVFTLNSILTEWTKQRAH
ncbi:hypothetical protein KAR91_77355 [Candidatus Pacearchaeota archaeon]|nr:hypothetical protein [Candidatus Pacearchaeota archaeon]